MLVVYEPFPVQRGEVRSRRLLRPAARLSAARRVASDVGGGHGGQLQQADGRRPVSPAARRGGDLLPRVRPRHAPTLRSGQLTIPKRGCSDHVEFVTVRSRNVHFLCGVSAGGLRHVQRDSRGAGLCGGSVSDVGELGLGEGASAEDVQTLQDRETHP